jgi:hypothetical protein
MARVARTADTGYSGDRSPAKHTILNDPQHPAVDVTGNVYLLELNNILIRIWIRRLSPLGDHSVHQWG